MSPTPKGCWDASCRTPVNTPVAWQAPQSPQAAWSPQAADALRLLFGGVPSGEELAKRLQAAAPESRSKEEEHSNGS